MLCSLANTTDELRLWITQKMLTNCNILIFTETWLNDNIPNSAIELAGHNIFRTNRTVADSGKSKGGGVCVYM